MITRRRAVLAQKNEENQINKTKRSMTGEKTDVPAKRAKRAVFGDVSNVAHTLDQFMIDSSKKNQSRSSKGRHSKSTTISLDDEVSVSQSSSNELSSSRDSNTDSSDNSPVRDADAGQSSNSSSQNSRRSNGGKNSQAGYITAEEAAELSLLFEPPTNETKPENAEAKGIDDDMLTEDDEPDFDQEMMSDIFHVPHYVKDIFVYYMQRETDLNKQMRAILVDWMVEVQENFELNHETLYQAVKMVDLYLDKVTVTRDALQLVGSTALFISAKFDERMPPMIDDFLYICDDAYSRRQLLNMEETVLKLLKFDIGYPISYRFLRRYAKVSRQDMHTLTLARFILENSLMHYEYVTECGSRMAAASLLLAIEMKKLGKWTETLENCTGYRDGELHDLKWRLNASILIRNSKLQTILSKYSHSVFQEVAKVPPLQR